MVIDGFKNHGSHSVDWQCFRNFGKGGRAVDRAAEKALFAGDDELFFRFQVGCSLDLTGPGIIGVGSGHQLGGDRQSDNRD